MSLLCASSHTPSSARACFLRTSKGKCDCYILSHIAQVLCSLNVRKKQAFALDGVRDEAQNEDTYRRGPKKMRRSFQSGVLREAGQNTAYGCTKN